MSFFSKLFRGKKKEASIDREPPVKETSDFDNKLNSQECDSIERGISDSPDFDFAFTQGPPDAAGPTSESPNDEFDINSLTRVTITLSDNKIKNRVFNDIADLKLSSITTRGNYSEFVVVDTETTGLHSGKDKIVELAAIRFREGEPVEMFHTLVNPQKKELDSHAMSVNQINIDDLANAPTIKQVLPAFDAFIGDSDLVGHNLMFDLAFINHAGSAFADTKRRYFCTLDISRKMFKTPKKKWVREMEEYTVDWMSSYDVENHKLGTMCDFFGINIPNQHRAYADAYATGRLFLGLIEHKKALAALKK